MMFDNTDGQQNLQLSSAFDHIQDELTKLNDQLTSGDQPNNPNVPKSTKASLSKKNRSNSRLLAACAGGSNQNGGKRQSSSRSASRSR